RPGREASARRRREARDRSPRASRRWPEPARCTWRWARTLLAWPPAGDVVGPAKLDARAHPHARLAWLMDDADALDPRPRPDHAEPALGGQEHAECSGRRPADPGAAADGQPQRARATIPIEAEAAGGERARLGAETQPEPEVDPRDDRLTAAAQTDRGVVQPHARVRALLEPDRAREADV